MSNFTVIRLRPAFSDKWRYSSWTIRVRRARKKNIRLPFDRSFRSAFSDLTSGQQFDHQRPWHVKMVELWIFCFSIITLNSESLRQLCYHHCIQPCKPRRMMYNMAQKMQKMKFDLRSSSWPDPNRSCCISFDPYWWENNGAVLKPVSCFYEKLLAKNGWWPLVTCYGHNWPFEVSPTVFWIWNFIHDTNSHNTDRIEQIR